MKMPYRTDILYLPYFPGVRRESLLWKRRGKIIEYDGHLCEQWFEFGTWDFISTLPLR